jgi:tetratricopeptide (TPR) repeat protein
MNRGQRNEEGAVDCQIPHGMLERRNGKILTRNFDMTMQASHCYRLAKQVQNLVSAHLLFLFSFGWTATPITAEAQSSALPTQNYYNALGLYNRDNLNSALRQFDRASSGYKILTANGERLFADAVCSLTMKGECYYKAGKIAEAQGCYRLALDMYMTNINLLDSVTFPASMEKDENAIAQARINWGKTTRSGLIGLVRNVQVQFGSQEEYNRALQNGGVVRRPEQRIVNVVEIMRCAALAMARRREIFGPLTKHAPYSRTLVSTLQKQPLINHPYSQAWSQLLHGMALASMKDYDRAAKIILSAAQAKGFDHPLTPIALFELANLNQEAGNLKAAAQLYLETTFSAAIFNQWDLLSQAFQRGLRVHLLSGNKGEYQPLALILQGDLFRRLPDSVQCNLLLLGAESQIENGLGQQALTFLNSAKKLINKDLQRSELAARYFFHLAQVNALAANTPDSMANARTGFQTYVTSSKRLFQITAAYEMDLASAYTERTAGVIYNELLNEPTAADWLASPLEAFTFLLSPIQDARLRWFQIAMNRKEYEKAMEIADNVRRFQFYNSMPLGGRLLAFRWMMEAPETMLSKEAVEQRKIFNVAHPNYAGLSTAASNIETQLRKIDGVPELSTDEGKLQINLVNELTKNSMQRELLLINASLKRNPAPMSFPPRLDFGELQKRMNPKQAAWIFFAQGKVFYSFILTKDSYKLEKMVPISSVKRYLPILLKKMGNIGPRLASVSQKVLESDGWKEPAMKLMEILQPKSMDWEQYDELVIVPDGMLWYLPFDALQVGKQGMTEHLAAKVAIRYAPTVSTIVPDRRKIRPQTNTTVVAGRLVRGQDPEVNQTELTKLQKVLPSASILNKKIGFDSASYSSQIDTLVIWDEIEQAERIAGFEWSPLQVDKGAPRSNVGAWMSLPFYGPEQYIIPGFNTAAGSGKISGNGNEIFLTVCGMMACGARTVLLSRWAVGGENDFNLTREFLAELKNDSAAQAWRRARELSMLNDINPDREPRIRSITGGVALKTDHPFFWSGYMLIDTGVKPVKDAPEKQATD